MFQLRQDKTFFDLFDRAADNMVHTAELFLEMLNHYELKAEFASNIREAEHAGDSITHDTIIKLDQTFITPLDREDIHALSTQIDEVVDYLDAAAQRMILYGVGQPNEDIIKQANVALQITKTLSAAIKQVRNLKEQEKLSRLLIEIHDWENKGDDHNHKALGRLFETGDPMYVLKWKELYELVEISIDACETAANILRSIMVKNA